MREFDYIKEYNKLLEPDIVSLLTQIHEFKSSQNRYVSEKPDTLNQLIEIAKIQSTEASNEIEGIVTTKERLKKLVNEKTMPKTRSEKEIAGYRDVLQTIHENHNYIPLKASVILQLHRDLYKFTGSSVGGSYKNTDNIIAEEMSDGTSRVRFQPVSAWETPEAVKKMMAAFDKAIQATDVDQLLLIPMFILDFLCIHPFNDGNGRMSRLLTLLLLYRAEYTVGMYISIEKLISDSKATYYEVLQESSDDWHESKNDYLPFVRYMLGIVIAAYRELESRIQLISTKGISKQERVREIIKNNVGSITKREILDSIPDISQMTVQRALADLLSKEEIVKIGGGRYTKYVWNWEK